MKYVHDLYLASINSWLFYKNNDQTSESYDWFMTRFGLTNNKWYDVVISRYDDLISTMSLNHQCTVYPVFYLSKDTIYQGKGTLKYPYVIK